MKRIYGLFAVAMLLSTSLVYAQAPAAGPGGAAHGAFGNNGTGSGPAAGIYGRPCNAGAYHFRCF